MENREIRLIPADPALAGAVADYYRRNREFLKPTDPPREDAFYTEETQEKLLAGEVRARREGRSCRFFITPVDEPEKVIGSIALNGIVWGAFRSCFLGYMLDKDCLRRGYMTGAVALVTDYAFRCLGLHRIEANVMPRNKASLGVLEKNGFREEGLARAYLNINGVWEDHIHMVKLNDALPPDGGRTLTARPYEPGDYEFVYELKKLCYHSYVDAIWGWNEEDQRARFAGFMTPEAQRDLAVLLLDGRCVGMVNWEFPDEETLMICNLCLLPECRGQGLGGKLLREMVEKSGRPVVTLQVYKDNPAIRLYRRVGFDVTGETEYHYQMALKKENGAG